MGTVIWAISASVWSRSSVPASRSDASTRNESEPRRSRSSSVSRALSTASAIRSAANWSRSASSLRYWSAACAATPREPVSRPSTFSGTVTTERRPVPVSSGTVPGCAVRSSWTAGSRAEP